MVVLLLQKIETLALEDWESAALPNEDDGMRFPRLLHVDKRDGRYSGLTPENVSRQMCLFSHDRPIPARRM